MFILFLLIVDGSINESAAGVISVATRLPHGAYKNSGLKIHEINSLVCSWFNNLDKSFLSEDEVIFFMKPFSLDCLELVSIFYFLTHLLLELFEMGIQSDTGAWLLNRTDKLPFAWCLYLATFHDWRMLRSYLRLSSNVKQPHLTLLIKILFLELNFLVSVCGMHL